MASTTTLEHALSIGGARIHRGRLQMRLPNRWKVAGKRSETFDLDDAGAAAGVLWYYERKRLHDAGYVGGRDDVGWMTLRVAANEYREHRVAVGNRRGDDLAPATLLWLDRSLRPWIEAPLGDAPLLALNPVDVEATLARRRRTAPTSARNEREQLLNVLRHAQRLGAKVPPELLALDKVQRPARRRRLAFSEAELDLLVESAPEYARRHVRFLARSGMRIGESLAAVDGWLDGDVLRIPASATKERRDKPVVLEPDEVALLAEQMLARPAGATAIFPKRSGAPWRTYGHFHKLVWTKARRRASAAAIERGLGQTVADRLAGARLHDLRSTAITNLLERGVPDDAIAARVGHADGGRLLREVYVQTSEERQRVGLESGSRAQGSHGPEPARRAAASTTGLVVPLPRKATT